MLDARILFSYTIFGLASGFALASEPEATPTATKAENAAETGVWLEQFTFQLPPDQKEKLPTLERSLFLAPPNWKEGHHVKNRRDYYLLQEADGNVFLRAEYIPGTEGKPIYKQIEWNIKENPYLSWRWRVQKWADGASILESSKEDSTAAVYVTIKSGIRNYVIKYVWSKDDEVGSGYSKGAWNPVGALKAEVIRKGGALNEWVVEKRNLIEDFKRLYKKDLPGDTAAGIGVMNDGDQTKSTPIADFDDFKVSPQ